MGLQSTMKSDGEQKSAVPVGIADALVGLWINTNPNPTTFASISIDLTINVGDVGAIVALTYCESVSAKNPVAFTATYNLSFKQMIVTGHLEGAQLDVESFSTFTDGSGRSAYHTIDTFVRGGYI
jgi:hypothetical protein